MHNCSWTSRGTLEQRTVRLTSTTRVDGVMTGAGPPPDIFTQAGRERSKWSRSGGAASCCVWKPRSRPVWLVRFNRFHDPGMVILSPAMSTPTTSTMQSAHMSINICTRADMAGMWMTYYGIVGHAMHLYIVHVVYSQLLRRPINTVSHCTRTCSNNNNIMLPYISTIIYYDSITNVVGRRTCSIKFYMHK